MNFFQLPSGEHINVAHIRKITFDGEFTQLYFSAMQHDCLKIPGDHVADIINPTKSRRQ